jgi:4-hydroxybenzoate polyprenyltransferase
MTLTERLSHYEKLMRLDKPIGILLLLWPTLWGQWLASNGRPDWLILWIFVMGVVLMRSAGCVINDYADRDFDPQVARTRERPLAAGKVSPKEALLLAAGLSLLAFLLVLPLNTLVLKLSVVALFLAASYPFTKRFFAIPQAYLGIAFGFGIPMSYAALLGPLKPGPAGGQHLLGNCLRHGYAVDREDDLRIGIKTSAITFGRFDLAAIALCYAATLGLLGWVGLQREMGVAFFGGLVVAAAIALYHMKLIWQRDPRQCFRAFLHNTWFGAAVFGGIALSYLLRSL